jgi:glucosamine-6-phosphate deaminase
MYNETNKKQILGREHALREERFDFENELPFEFDPAPWIPFRDKEVLQRCRNMTREQLTAHDNPDMEIHITGDADALFTADFFTRIKESDEQEKRLVVILPNPQAVQYSNIVYLCNRFGVSCRNLHTFAMDEWADQDGNVAPLTYKLGLGHSFMNNFFKKLNPELRPDISQMNCFTNENVDNFSDLIEEAGDGGADVCYSATGWPGHIAFIDPDTKEFASDSIEEFLTLGSRIVTQHPLTTAQNSLSGKFGGSGDIANIPYKAATIGPRDVKNSRQIIERQCLANLGGTNSWQRMISRLSLHGPVTMQVPSSIIQLFKTTVFMSEDLARPIVTNETGRY